MKIFTIFDCILKQDFEIIVGSSSQENWDIIDDSCQNDIWFHLENLPSCHVILTNKHLYIVLLFVKKIVNIKRIQILKLYLLV